MMKDAMNAKEAILAAAKQTMQSHGYSGLNLRDLADVVGIKAASIYYHFAGKADLGAAVAKRYWEDTAACLDAMFADASDPISCLIEYPQIFRMSLENGNRMCLCSFMSAEYDDLPDPVKVEVKAFVDVNVSWLDKVLVAAGVTNESGDRARAIFAAVAGAQLMARSHADIALFDALITTYRKSGLLTGQVTSGRRNPS